MKHPRHRSMVITVTRGAACHRPQGRTAVLPRTVRTAGLELKSALTEELKRRRTCTEASKAHACLVVNRSILNPVAL